MSVMARKVSLLYPARSISSVILCVKGLMSWALKVWPGNQEPEMAVCSQVTVYLRAPPAIEEER